jgi:serine protease AprX
MVGILMPPAKTEAAMRYKVRFGDPRAYNAAQSINAVDHFTQVKNSKRNILSIELPANLQNSSLLSEISKQFEELENYYGAIISEEYRFDLDFQVSDVIDNIQPDDPTAPSLQEVLKVIKAEEAWQLTKGEGVSIAVIDTGIDGSRPEFPSFKRAGHWEPEGHQPWTDWKGHGTMVACIAAATNANGGEFCGVAPNAGLIACKTLFYEVELISIYDYLADLARTGMPIVAINSYGNSSGKAPVGPQDNDINLAMEDAIDAGVVFVFSAGNNHVAAGGNPESCEPNSIWLHKCRSNLMTVGACNLNREMWYYSSRGPGQYFGQQDMNRKPDVIAPTPEGGRILYGERIGILPNGWGTSGACPQVGGLAALLLARNPNLQREEIFQIIRSTSAPLCSKEYCEGNGLIDCKSAVDAAMTVE